MASKPTAQQCHALTSKYIDLYVATYGTKPSVNRYSARWGFEAVLMDYTPSEAVKLLEYYFSTYSNKKHSLDWFLYNYEKLASLREESKVAHERQRVMMEESQRRVEEWRARGNYGIEGN